MSDYRVAFISSEIGKHIVGGGYDKEIVVGTDETFFERLYDAGSGRSSRKPITQLDIYAHCVGALTFGGYIINAIDQIYAYGYSDGHPTGEAYDTYGVKIGSDWITSITARKFEGFAAMFAPNAGIAFRACEIAKISPDVTTKRGHYSGNGLKLCQAIAAASGVYVRASASPQYYTDANGNLTFEAWTPPVFEFSPGGGYWPD